jgi:hypothetical protein
MAKVDLNELRAKYEDQKAKNENKGKGGSNNEFLKNFLEVKVGDNPVRILPPKEEGLRFYVENFIHRIAGDNDQIKNVQCLRVHGENCPLCELYFALFKPEKGGGDHLKLVARSIKRGARYYMNVLDRTTNEVKILSIGIKLWEKILSDIANVDYEVVDPDTNQPDSMLNPKVGYDYKIVKKMVEEWPDYSQSGPRPKQSPVAKTDGEINSIMEKCHDIYALIAKKPEYEEVKLIAETIIATKAPTINIFGTKDSNDNYVANLKD